MPFRPRLGAQRITGLQRDQACYLLAARLQCVADLHQHSAAHARVGAAPGRVCLGGGLGGAIDVLRATARHQTDGAAVRGVLHRDGMARCALHPFPVDQHEGVAEFVFRSGNLFYDGHDDPPASMMVGNRLAWVSSSLSRLNAQDMNGAAGSSRQGNGAGLFLDYSGQAS